MMQVEAQGDNWRRATADVCIAGLGWLALTLDGVAELRVWRQEGIAVTTRAALLPDMAKTFEKPGWSSNTKQQFKHMEAKQAKQAKKGGKAPGAVTAKQNGAGCKRDTRHNDSKGAQKGFQKAQPHAHELRKPAGESGLVRDFAAENAWASTSPASAASTSPASAAQRSSGGQNHARWQDAW